MARVAATLPGYASVARASELLHLAPRSVRDLIYAGRIPSLRVGRQHFIRAADVELERRRRLGLPMPRRRPPPRRTHREVPRHPAEPRNASLDDALRRQRATERSEMVARWAHRHGFLRPNVPARVLEVTELMECDACRRSLRQGRRYVDLSPDASLPGARLCVTCGRRALLEWADRRRQEATAARQLSQSLGEPEQPPAQQLELSAQEPTPAPGETRAA